MTVQPSCPPNVTTPYTDECRQNQSHETIAFGPTTSWDADHPLKRQRTDMENADDEAASTYSMTEMDNDGKNGGTPFTFVSYKKDRASGIPVFFKPTQPGSSFWRVNPNVLASEIVAVSQEKLLSHRITKDGSLAVNVASLPSANRLLAVATLSGVACTAIVPKSYSRSIGKITGVPLEYRDEELLEYLKDYGVLSLRRQASYYRQEDETAEVKYRESVILHFRADKPPPTRVMLGFTSHPVREHFEAAVQCFRCQRHGHVAKYCRGEQRCKVCAGQHSYKECSSRQEPRCANCGGQHAASYGGCPRKKAASMMRKQELQLGKAPRRRTPPVNPNVIHLPQTSLPLGDTNHFPPMHVANPPSSVSPINVSRKPTRRQEKFVSKTRNGTPSSVTMAAPVPAPRKPHAYRTSVKTAQSSEFESINVEKIIIPLIFAALKAILRSFPDSNSMPEVQTLLSMEHLLNNSSQGTTVQNYG